jgi:hypothetical protein
MEKKISLIEKGEKKLCIVFMSDDEEFIDEIRDSIEVDFIRIDEETNLRLKSLEKYVSDRIFVDDDFLKRY